MGTRDRTRPDESRKPGEITPEGHRRLQREAQQLWSLRARVVDGVATAAAEGDRSENAEYIYGKMKLSSIDRKLAFIAARLEVLTVVDELPADDGRVHFGCWVDVEGEDGEARTYRIVGPDESDVDRGHISAESPVARALLGRELDDEVTVRRPKGPVTFTIVAIRARAGPGDEDPPSTDGSEG